MPAPALGPADVGAVVTLRIRTPAGPADVVGRVLSVATDAVVLRRRDGRVEEVALAGVVTGRRVPPTAAERVGVAELELVAARGWRALSEAPLGEWLLRASGGFTRRANSALAVGDPGCPLPQALASVQEWYAEHGLPAVVQLPAGGARAGLADVLAEALAEVLAEHGWAAEPGAVVMTAELAHVLRAGAAASGAGVDVRLDAAPDEAWLAAWRRDDGPLPPSAEALLTNHPAAVFASVRDGDRCAAVARASVDGRWAGLFAVEVAPDRRRQGLGTAVTVAALRWAAEQGARHAHLQTVPQNVAAIATYERLGFTNHHGYTYHAAPHRP